MRARGARGFTLIEMLIWIVAVASMIGGLLAYADMTSQTQKANALAQEVSQLIQAFNRVYGPNAKVSGAPYLAISVLTVAPFMGTYGNTAGGVNTPWGTGIVVNAFSLYGTGGDAYNMRVAVPARACVDAVTQLHPMADALYVSNTSNPVKTVGGAAVTPATINAACAAAGTVSGTNVLFFIKS